MEKFLILGAPEFQIPLIKAAKARGFYTVILDFNTAAPGIAFADEYIKCSLKDSAAALEIAERIKPVGVSPGMCDVAVYSAALIAERLGLPGLKIDAARRATDKFLMIEAFRTHFVPHPAYLLPEEGEKLPGSLRFPIISKPLDMAGSRGVRLSRNLNELEANIAQSRASGDSGRIILEEYVRGPEVSVELLVLGRRAHVLEITDKITSGPPYFSELGHVQPSSLPDNMKKRIAAAAMAAAEALELENTFAHAELIISDEGPKLIEIGARMGGDGIQSYLLGLSSGINAPEIALSLALGEDVILPQRSRNMASAILFLPSRAGKLLEVRGLERLEASEGIRYSGLLSSPGSLLNKAEDNSGRIAYAVSEAKSPEEALKLCRAGLRELQITIDEGGKVCG